ncbi:MAG: lycopene cyclase family protein [Pseudomonadota bacterium]
MSTVKPAQADSSVDLVIIGAGCAGLSLARELSAQVRRGRKIPSTLLLEPRREYTTDRSWCYWTREHSSQERLTDAVWPQWKYGDRSQSITHSVNGKWVYRYQNAKTFYENCLEEIAQSQEIDLRLNEVVEDVASVEENFIVKASKSIYQANRVIDTRPPSASALDTAILKQVFYGIEVEHNQANLFDHHEAQVMVDMAVDEYGFKFHYLLPISPTHCLIEVTRFTSHRLGASDLRDEVYELASLLTGTELNCVEREEGGVIPMGIDESPNTSVPNWISVGLGNGSARPATGYAFQRIQKWAEVCAKELSQNDRVIGIPSDPLHLKWMDRIFLLTLKNNPTLGPTLFMALANRVKPERLVRFLTDCPTWLDIFAIIRALPTAPLLKTAIDDLKQKTTSHRRQDTWIRT